MSKSSCKFRCRVVPNNFVIEELVTSPKEIKGKPNPKAGDKAWVVRGYYSSPTSMLTGLLSCSTIGDDTRELIRSINDAKVIIKTVAKELQDTIGDQIAEAINAKDEVTDRRMTTRRRNLSEAGSAG